jgi:hypothetical protein
MPDPTAFLTAMAALSAATQTFVEHVIKQRWNWLDESKQGTPEKRRHFTVHALAFLVGGGLAWSVGFQPLAYLDVQHGALANAGMAGLLVSFGGSLFDEALGAVREFKKAQQSVRQGANLTVTTPTPGTIRVSGDAVDSA